MNLSHPGVLRNFIEFVSQSNTDSWNIWVLFYSAFVVLSMPFHAYWYSCFMYDRNFFQ